MTLLTVSTVKGAPGGSTIALLLAGAVTAAATDGRRCILAECDLSGGDLAPRLGLPGVPGVASLALAARHGLTVEILLAHTQSPAMTPQLNVLPGIAGPEQGMALGWILGELARVLADPSVVAIADLGRLRIDRDSNEELRSIAKANVLVTNDDVASLLHAKAAVESARASGTTLGIVLAGERRRRVSHVSQATGAEVVGAVRYDPDALSRLLDQGRAARRGLRIPRRSSGLFSDAAAIVSKLTGSEVIADPCTVRAAAGEGASSVRSNVLGRLRRRAVLIG
jgi:MinD-like ATPase involved in chromosome partitioning or flagellar assembly